MSVLWADKRRKRRRIPTPIAVLCGDSWDRREHEIDAVMAELSHRELAEILVQREEQAALIEDTIGDEVPTLGGLWSYAMEWRNARPLRQVCCDVGLGLLTGLLTWGAVEFVIYAAGVLG